MKEIAKLLQAYKNFRLIPEAELVAALKIDLKIISDLRVAPLPKSYLYDFPEENIKLSIYLVNGENVVTICIKDEVAPKITMGNDNHCWASVEESNDLPVFLSERLEDARFFLMNGQLKDERKYVQVKGESSDFHWNQRLFYELIHSVPVC